MYETKPLVKAISLAISASLVGVSPIVFAQDVSGEGETIEEIVTTGSRIKKDGFSSSAPLDVILTDRAVVSGISDLGDLLQSTPIAAGASQVTAATSTAFVQNGGMGAQTLSLRGLGANRTLTLINGRRAGPAGTRGGVSAFDLNVIPLSAIERIEILKDGASSIYGSDAVAGVVNIFTKKGDGGSIDGFLMQPNEHGGEETRLSATWGRSFDRGSFRLTADYNKTDELARGDRDYFACTEQYIFDAAGGRADVIDPRTGKPSCRDSLWGHVWLYDYQGPGGNVPTPRRTLAQYDYDGDLGQHIPGIAVDPNNPSYLVAPPGWFLVNYDRQSDGVTNMDHPFQDAQSMIPDVEKTTFFGDAEFDLTDDMTLFAEVLLNRRKTSSNDYRQFWGYIYNESSDIGFTPNPLSVGWQGDQWFSPTPITDHFDTVTEVDYERYVAGLRGNITNEWSFEVSYQYSQSDGTYQQDIIFADSVSDQNFLGGSCVGQATSERGVPCQDIPWLDPEFLAGRVDPSISEFLFGQDTGRTLYKQSAFEAFVSGSFMDLPAGRIGLAAGVQVRDDDIHDVPGSETLAGNSYLLSSAGITTGDQKTKAVFAEVDVPLIADRTGIKDLTLNASARWTDVNTYGDGTTYKVGLNWQIVDSFRLRANHGTSFRTPALFELYLADQTAFARQSNIDPCNNWGTALDAGSISQRVADNCAADTSSPLYPNGLPSDFTGGTTSAEVISSGGLGLLDAETSDSSTFGFVWQPAFADLSVSVDYFDIEVKNQVDQLGAGSIVFGCYDSTIFPAEQLCNLFNRSGLNAGIDDVQNAYINIATQSNAGVDLALKYATDVASGKLSFDLQYTLQQVRETALFADDIDDRLGRFGNPENVARLWTTYDFGDWSLFWGARYTGSVSNEADLDGPETTYRGETVYRVLGADSVLYHDFSVTYFAEGIGATVVAGLSNAFDKNPPQITTLGGPISHAGRSAFYTQYDWLGRRFFLNLTKDFD